MHPRTAIFHRLHQSGCFVIPNPWDAGSARALAGLGFQALATTSAGCAWAAGEPDHRVTLPALLAHLREIVDSTGLPVSADFENGLADDPAAVAANVTAAIGTGVAGLSIEDATGGPAAALYEERLAVERIEAARRAIDASGTGVLLTARCEAFLVGTPEPARVALERLGAFAGAGGAGAAGRVCRRGRRLLVCAGSARPRADCGDGEGGGAAAGQCPRFVAE